MLDMLDWAWLAPRQTVSQSHSLTVPLRNREGGARQLNFSGLPMPKIIFRAKKRSSPRRRMYKLYAHEMHAHENAHRITICVQSAPHADPPSPELALESSGPNKPYKKPGLTYRPGQAGGVGLCGAA
jgi:hypothetical protein